MPTLPEYLKEAPNEPDQFFVITIEAVRFMPTDPTGSRPILQTFKGVLSRRELVKSKDRNLRIALEDLEAGKKGSINSTIETRPATHEETKSYVDYCTTQALNNSVMGGPIEPYYRDPKESN